MRSLSITIDTLRSWEERIRLDNVFTSIVPNHEGYVLLLGHRVNSYYLEDQDQNNLRAEFSKRLEQRDSDCKYYHFMDDVRQSATYLLQYKLEEVLLFCNYFESVLMICADNKAILQEMRSFKNLFTYNCFQSLINNEHVIFSLLKERESSFVFYTSNESYYDIISESFI